MAHFAEIDENNIVTRVIVAERDVIDSGQFGPPESWIQTSYNTVGGIHKLGGTPIRKNYAGVGYTYDIERDAFIPPKPYASWILDEFSCQWDSPVPYPEESETTGNYYMWDEENIRWSLLV